MFLRRALCPLQLRSHILQVRKLRVKQVNVPLNQLAQGPCLGWDPAWGKFSVRSAPPSLAMIASHSS